MNEPLGLQHKDLLAERLKAADAGLSEYTFANLYLFRHSHHFSVVDDGETIFVRGMTYDGRSYLMPTADIRAIDASVLRRHLSSVDFLFPIPDTWLASLSSQHFTIEHRDGDMDYVYTVDKMSSYGGRRLHKKRNLLKQFLEHYRHQALPLTNERLEDARFILDDWQASSQTPADETDYAAAQEALQLYDELGLCGGIYYADDEPAGYVIGEEINDETFVLHFAKARARFKGIYQYMFNVFAKILPLKYRYLNLEQDLERENLRVFKSSYVPDAMLRKARVSLKSHP